MSHELSDYEKKKLDEQYGVPMKANEEKMR